MSYISTYRQNNQRAGALSQLELLEEAEVSFHDKLTKHTEHWSGSGHVYVLTDYPKIFAADHYMHFLFSYDVSSGAQKLIRFANEKQLFTSTSPSPCPLLIWDESVIYCRDYKVYGYDMGLNTIDFRETMEKPQTEGLLTTSPVAYKDSLIAAFSVGGEPEPILIVELSPGGNTTTSPLDLGANDLEVPLACDNDSLYVCGMFELACLSLPLNGSDPLWTFEYPHCSIAKPPAVSKEVIFLGVRGYEGRYMNEYVLVAVNKEDGEKIWDIPVGNSMSSLCVTSDKIIFHDHEMITGCDLTTGNKCFEIGLSTNSWYSDPLMELEKSNLVMIENHEKEAMIVIYSLKEEEKVKDIELPGARYKYLHADDQSLVAGGADGDILALKYKPGNASCS